MTSSTPTGLPVTLTTADSGIMLHQHARSLVAANLECLQKGVDPGR